MFPSKEKSMDMIGDLKKKLLEKCDEVHGVCETHGDQSVFLPKFLKVKNWACPVCSADKAKTANPAGADIQPET